jgi:hypothetical protein
MVKNNTDKKEKNKDENIKVKFIKVASVSDIARYNCNFAKNTSSIISIEYNGKYRLIGEGEKITDTAIYYYFDSDKISDYLIYRPTNNKDVEFSNSIRGIDGYNNYVFNIINALNNPFKETDINTKNIKQVKIKNYKSLILGIANKNIEDSNLPKLYLFKSGSKYFISSFELFNSGETPIFAYSEIDTKGLSDLPKFFKYDYNSDIIEINNNLLQDNLIYLRIINLSDSLNFFRPE